MSCNLDQTIWERQAHVSLNILPRDTYTWLTRRTCATAFGKKWTQVYEAREAGEKVRGLKFLRELVARFAGVADLPAVDLPAVGLVPELLELYPDAKVVLVTREPDRWWDSFGNMLNTAQLLLLSVLAAPMPGLRRCPETWTHWHGGTLRLMREKTGHGTAHGPGQLV